jgi:transposase
MYQMKEALVYLGVDIAKSYLDAAIGDGKCRFANEALGHRQLSTGIKQMEMLVQVICEPGGGYERAQVRALVGVQLKISLVAANRVRQFARAAGIFWPRPIAWMPRCCALLESALVAARHNPILRAFYLRLRAAGKPAKLALTASMRKLLIVLNSALKPDPTYA